MPRPKCVRGAGRGIKPLLQGVSVCCPLDGLYFFRCAYFLLVMRG